MIDHDPEVWIVFVGAYSDRRAVAALVSEDLAMQAAESLLGLEHIYQDVEVERFTIQRRGPAILDGSTAMIWRHSGEWVRDGGSRSR